MAGEMAPVEKKRIDFPYSTSALLIDFFLALFGSLGVD